jgi:hypothetical protein
MLRRLLLLLVIISLILISLSGCSNQQSTTTGQTTTSSTNSTSTSPPTSELPYRTDCQITLSSVPKLGDTVEVTFTVNVIKSDNKISLKTSIVVITYCTDRDSSPFWSVDKPSLSEYAKAPTYKRHGS